MNEIATVQHQEPSMLTDLRGTLMTLSVPNMELALGEFSARRNAFRLWLMEQLILGVHYGVPPGCEPRKGVNPDQWKAKPSLYKSGADFLCDLMGWRSTFSNDVTTWEMLGKPECVCLHCVLLDKNGSEVGQGRGARRKGEKSMEINATIKMAEKCAKVDAIINALSLSDMFTQDIEDLRPKHDNPEPDRAMPQQAPRSERVTPSEIKRIADLWKSNNRDAGFEEWCGFTNGVTGVDFNPKLPAKWTREMFDKVEQAIAAELLGDTPDDIPY